MFPGRVHIRRALTRSSDGTHALGTGQESGVPDQAPRRAGQFCICQRERKLYGNRTGINALSERGDQGRLFFHSRIGIIYQNSFQETLRVHTSVPDLIREAFEDDMLPLSKPIVGRSGKIYNEIFIPKGSKIHASESGYNTYVW
jgi:hypothetical protein